MLNTAMINKIFFNKTMIKLAAVTAISLLVQIPSHAGVYKWTDENGEVHYGDQPGSANAQAVTIRKNETTAPRTINKAEEDKAEKTQHDQAAEPEKLVPEPISKQEKRRLCEEGKHDYAVISSRGRMREINAKGEYVYLSEQQRQQRLSAAKMKQREYCE